MAANQTSSYRASGFVKQTSLGFRLPGILEVPGEGGYKGLVFAFCIGKLFKTLNPKYKYILQSSRSSSNGQRVHLYHKITVLSAATLPINFLYLLHRL